MADSSGIRPLVNDSTIVARTATIDGFADATTGPGVALRHLEPLTTLAVQTRNTRYRIIISSAEEILIQGGVFFPDPTPAHLDGASLGGSLLKLGWIGIGMRMEIRAGDQRVVTTPVRSVTVEGSSGQRPH